jgi:hypothetical protein
LDEALFIAVPMAILAGLLWLIRRRAEPEVDDDEDSPPQERDDPKR